MSDKKVCCGMRKKIVVGIAGILSEEQCGVPDSVMVDYHDFDYQSDSGVPVSLALKFAFCPWCGTQLGADQARRTTEVIRGVEEDDRGEAWKQGQPEEPPE